MTRKKWRIQRVMVVPANWQGSVEHFYHFFLGYFVPVVLWQERTGTMEFAVRDCGPMNLWFTLLRPGTDLHFMPPGVMLERYLSHRQERRVVHGWDDPTRFHRASLNAFRSTILGRAGVTQRRSTGDRLRITVLERKPSPEFFLQGSETHGSGADWRSIPNIEEIVRALTPLGRVNTVDTAELTPVEQIEKLAHTDLLVAQHGAGLANMVWMPPGSAVLEIKPPLVPTINEIFANLAAALRLDHASVSQADEHAVVPADEVALAAQALATARGSLIPKPTGRWPLPQLRQLPRRL